MPHVGQSVFLKQLHFYEILEYWTWSWTMIYISRILKEFCGKITRAYDWFYGLFVQLRILILRWTEWKLTSTSIESTGLGLFFYFFSKLWNINFGFIKFLQFFKGFKQKMTILKFNREINFLFQICWKILENFLKSPEIQEI